MSEITHICGARWTGLNRAHCSVCCETFGGITSFDAHRRAGQCLNPEELGLIRNPRNIWVSDYSGPDGD